MYIITYYGKIVKLKKVDIKKFAFIKLEKIKYLNPTNFIDSEILQDAI